MFDPEPGDTTPDICDGLTPKERAILYCLHEMQKEFNGRQIPTVMLYGRVVELVDISQTEFQTLLCGFSGLTQHGEK